MKPASFLIRHHYERYDGKGYPDGLAGDDIPVGARIISVAETYDTLKTDSCFRKGLSLSDSIDEIMRVAGSQLDHKMVRLLVNKPRRR